MSLGLVHSTVARAGGHLALALSVLLVVQPVLSRPPQGAAPQKLNIVILEGDGAINNIRQRTAREPIVQVTDENNQPVAGASVTFLLPDSGPGAKCPSGARSLTVISDNKGQAVAKGLRHNGQQGKFEIQVRASYQELETTATISQANAVLTAAAGGISGKVLAILAIAGAGAAAGLYAATSGGNGNGTPGPAPTPAPPVTITPGTPSVGAPAN